ncbi:MurR/RpiR family transcriptional regulator [Sporosarcina aquimarina]|uniref:MurR/RpiR family transcriptional regulator n=1 Tax=Sporosarcina aquimarina TaxID=114975 RepID=A0ABU4FVY2_9BACL|nr:MurR/RpiR family transcriptional regulator [Sporosarcina aquimarina]MDW0108821.1 MurR/RpiR family transcriptional regulator [Sporosarcina aquimarina]
MLGKIRGQLGSFSKTELRIAEYVLNHAELIPTMTTKELAEKADVSEASVVRFTKSVGVASFKTFKILLAQELVTTEEYITDFSITQKKDSPYELFQKVVQVNRGAIDLLLSSIEKKELEKAVKAFQTAKRIMFYGVGGSAIPAMDAQFKFAKLGYQVEYHADFHYMLSAIPFLNENDIFVAISMSGTTRDVVELAKFAKKQGAVLICITNINKSPLYKEADILLATPNVEKDFRVGSITSRMTQLTVIDSLYISLVNQMGESIIDRYENAHRQANELRR